MTPQKKYRHKNSAFRKKYSNNRPPCDTKNPLILLWPILPIVIFLFAISGPSSWNNQNIPVKYEIDFPQAFHKASKPEDSAITIIEKLAQWIGNPFSSDELLDIKDTWRLHKGAYAGFSLQKTLNSHNIDTKTLRGTRMNDKERAEMIEDHIRQDNPVLLMVSENNEPRYILVLGYNTVAETFEVYDPTIEGDISNITYDNNGDASGNATYDMTKIMNLWSQGSIYGFYNYYGIVIIKN